VHALRAHAAERPQPEREQLLEHAEVVLLLLEVIHQQLQPRRAPRSAQKMGEPHVEAEDAQPSLW
jgi:hypothetical protein